VAQLNQRPDSEYHVGKPHSTLRSKIAIGSTVVQFYPSHIRRPTISVLAPKPCAGGPSKFAHPSHFDSPHWQNEGRRSFERNGITSNLKPSSQFCLSSLKKNNPVGHSVKFVIGGSPEAINVFSRVLPLVI
jgi:hypothetical protein